MQRDDEGRTLGNSQDRVIRQGEQIKQQEMEIKDLKKGSSDELRSFYDAPIKQPVLDSDREFTAHAKTRAGVASARTARARFGGGIEYLSAPSGNRKPVRYAASAAVPVRSEIPRSVLKDSKTTNFAPEKITRGEMPRPSLALTKTDGVEKTAAPKADTVVGSGLPPASVEKIDASAKVNPPESGDLANCQGALKEAERGLHAGSDADRLFYLRRAARLCPSEPSYHVELGKLYSTIGKSDDAKYELRQAIDLDPNNQVARDELSIIENAGGGNH
jgi:tetratricopeptide (TPR) repeat protein